MKKFGYVLFGIAGIFLFGLSCKIGLGPSVDTQAPELIVTNPASDSVIRDKIAFLGSFTDDGVIKSLTVTLTPTSGSEESYVFDAELDNLEKEGTWSCIIDPKDSENPIPDATYEASVVITDTYLHTTKITRLFTVDNTPPLIVLQRPSSKDSTVASDIDSYGQLFTLEGQAADDNNVELIEVSFYSDPECTNFLNKVSLTNVPPTISLDVAKFVEGQENDYSKIYGSTSKDGTKPFYCKIVAYDGAQRYPIDGSEQSAADKNGNAISHYYLYDDISTGVLNSYKITEVYHMLNGAYARSGADRAADVVSSIKSTLNDNVVTIGSFTLNPANNPTFLVSGKDQLKRNGTDFTANEDYYISNGSTAIIEVSQGLDGIPLDGDSLKVYVRECNEYGVALTGAPKIYPVTTRSKSGSSYKFVAQMNTTNSSMVVGNNYVFGLDGNDTSGNPVLPKGNGYGFYFAATGTAPALVVEQPAASITYLKKDSTLTVSGYATVDAGCPSFSIKNGDVTLYNYACQESQGVHVTETQIKYTFSYEIPASAFEVFDSNGKQIGSDFALAIKASNEGVSSVVNKSVMYDIEGPEITIADPTPTGNLYQREASGLIKEIENPVAKSGVLNGTVSFKVNIGDEFDTVDATTNKPRYEFVKGGQIIASDIIANATRDTITIDTTLFGSTYKGLVTLNIHAWDRAGNKTTKTVDYYVDQDSDLPAVLPVDLTKLKFSINTKEKVNDARGPNMIAQGGQMTLKIVDDDGVANVKVYRRAVTNEDPTADSYQFNDGALDNYKEIDKNQGGSTEVLFSLNAPSTAGYFRYFIEVTDIGGAKATVGPFDIFTTASAPTITTVVASPSFISTAATNKDASYPGSFKNTITVASNQAPFYVFYKTDSSTRWDLETGRNDAGAAYSSGTNPQYVGTIAADNINNPNEYAYVHTGLSPATTTNYYYIVLDKNWQESNVKSVQGVVDNTPPTVTLTNLPSLADTRESVTSFTFQGKAADTNTSSTVIAGVEKIEITVTDVANPSKTHTETVTGTTNWVYSLEYASTNPNWKPVFADEGNKKVTLKVYDNAGNYSEKFTYKGAEISSITFCYDKAVPVLEVKGAKDFMPTSGLTLNGKATDTYKLAANALKVTEKFKAAGSDTYVETDASKSANTSVNCVPGIGGDKGGNWSNFRIPLDKKTPQDGTYSYTFTLKDEAGNSVSEPLTEIKVDTTKPGITFTKPAALAYSKATSYEFAGKIDEPNLEEATAVLFKDGVATTTTTTLNVNSSTGVWSWTIPDLAEDKYTVKVTAKDKAGNSDTQESPAVTIDTTVPTTTLAGSGTKKSDGTAAAALEDSVTYYANGNYTLSGTITELNYDKTKVTISATKDGSAATAPAITFSGTGNKDWSISGLNAAANTKATYKYTLSITDLAGNITTKTLIVMSDKTKPTISITTPTEGEIKTVATIKLSGTVKAEGIGLKKVEYSLNADATTPTWSSISNISAGTTYWEHTLPSSTAQGVYKLRVRATDLFGNVTYYPADSASQKYIKFFYDNEKPHVTIDSLNTYYITGDSITLTGTAYDTDQLSSITLKDGTTALNKTITYKRSGSTVTLASAKSDSTKLTWSTTIPVSELSEGSHNFTVTATDIAGQSETASASTTVDISVPTMTLSALPNREDTKGTSVTLSGSYSDKTTGSGVKTVKLTIKDKTTTSKTYTKDAILSQGTWTCTVNFKDDNWKPVFADEGVKVITLYAQDNAGLENSKFTYDAVADNASVEFTYDKADPELTVTGFQEYMPTTGLQLSGSATDSYKLASNALVVTEEFKASGATKFTETAASKDSTKNYVTGIGGNQGGAWSNFRIPLDNATPQEGTYHYSFALEDSVGNIVESEVYELSVDTTPPAVTITKPAAAIYLNSNNYVFEGTAQDGDASKDTLASVKAILIEDGAEQADKTTDLTPNASHKWSFTQYGLSDKKYSIKVTAKDKAGNPTVITSPVITVDTTLPASTVKGTGLYNKEGTSLAANSDLSSTVTYFAKAAYSITGTITEVNYSKDKVKLTVTKDGEDVPAANVPAITFSGTGNKVWTIAGITSANAAYKYTLAITDLAGNEKDYSFSVTYDNTAPTLTISAPTANELFASSAITAKGEVHDDGIGLKSIEYSVDNGTNWTALANVQAGQYSWNVALKDKDGNALKEGKYNLKVRATDKLGQIENAGPVAFDYDAGAPTLTFTALNNYYNSTNTSITLTGTAYDTNQLSSIVITDNGTDVSTGTTYKKGGSTVTLASATSDSTKLTWAKALTVSNLTQGNHKFVVTATDIANQATSETHSVIVDTVAPAITLNSMPGKADTRNTSFTFGGSITEETSGIKSLKMKIASTSGKYREVPVTVGASWFYTVNYDDDKLASAETGAEGDKWSEVFADEGVKTVTLSYEDYAGNTGTKYTYNGSNNASFTFVYDNALPEITVDDTTVLTYMSANGFTIKGTATDSYKLAASAVTVKEEFKKKGASSFATTAASGQTITFDDSTTGGTTGGAWSLPVPLNKAGITLEDGEYKYTFTVKDSVDNSVSTTAYTVTVDLTAPVISITTPSSDTDRRKTNAITDTNYGFVGKVTSEEYDRISGVYYKVLTSTQAKTASNYAAVETADVLSKDKWIAAGWKAATLSKESGKNYWKAYEEMNEALGYKIYTYAVDKAGNVSTVQSCLFDVDRAYPTVVTKINDTEYSSAAVKVETSAYTFKFNASDTLELESVTVGVSRNGTTLTKDADFTVTKSDTLYTVAITSDEDGLYEYSITAKDTATKETTVTRSVRLDRVGPVLQIVSPDLSGYQTTEKVTISGSATDDSKVAGVYYAYNVSSAPTTGGDWTGWTPVETGFTSSSWKITAADGNGLQGVEASPRKLFIVGVDEHGNIGTVVEKTLKIDLYAPSLTTTTTDLYTNTTFTISAVAADNNGIKEVSISDGTNTYKSTDSPATLTYASATNTYSRSFTITKDRTSQGTDDLADGTYTITVSTTDNADRTTQKARTVIVDTTKPTIGSVPLNWGSSAENAKSIHAISSATFSLNPTDTNLDTVEYYINDGSVSAITAATSSSITDLMWSNVPAVTDSDGNVTGYERSYKFSDGRGNVHIKVTDKAGNVSYADGPAYYVDTTKPDSCTVDTIDGAAPDGIKLINGKAALTLVMTAKDQNDTYSSGVKVGLDQAKVASVTLKSIGGTDVTATGAEIGTYNSTNKNWTITIPATRFSSLTKGTKAIAVTVTDTAGNTKVFEVVSVNLDNVVPATAITSPIATNNVNGKLSVSGTVTEDNPKSVALYYSTASTAPTSLANWTLFKKYTTEAAPQTPAANTTYGKTASQITSWTFSDFDFDTNSGAKDETLKKHSIWLLAYSEDAAGNVSVITSPTKYNVDMDDDRPVIKFNNLGLAATMTSSALVGFENSELYGSITDDDGVPATMYYQIVTKDSDYNANSYVAAAANSNFTYSNGSFTLKFLDSNGKAYDGIKHIFFKVTDNAGTTFESKTSATYDQTGIKLSDGTNEFGTRPASGTASKASVAYIKVDTQAPDVTGESYYRGATASTTEADWSGSISAATFGGVNSKFFLRQYAYDANDVTSVVVRIPYDSADASTITGYTNTADAVKPSVSEYYEYAFTKQEGTGSTLKLNNITYTKWISSVIDVTGMKTGTRSSQIIVSDGIKTKSTLISLTIDNTAPTVTFDTPVANDQMRAAFLMKGQFTDGDQGTQLWYNLSTSTTAGTWSASPVAATTAMNWRISFDGDENPQDSYTHDGVPKQIIATLLSDVEIASSGDNSGKAVWKTAGTVGGVTHAADDLYTPITTVYFHFKVQDALGNESTTYIPLKLDPQGDIPVITLVSPDSTQTTLGGTIRFSGSAEDDATIAGLYVEVDPQYNAANGFVAWSSTHKTPAYTKDGVTVPANAPADVITSANYPNNPYELINEKVASGKKKTTTVKAIYIGNGLSWNIALNKYGEFDNKEAGTNKVAVRFYAVDVDGNMSQPTDPFVFDVDCDKPKIGNSQRFYLKKYADNAAGTGDVTASVEYTDGMWLKGEWWLEGSVEDENGITSVTMQNVDISGSSTAHTWSSTSGYITHYKVGNATANLAGNLEYTLAVTDGDSKTNEKTFSINYDNKAPTLAETTDENYSISSTVKNSNGFYTVRSTVTEGSDESGFDKVVFYFKRTTTGYQNVYDSYMAKTYTNASSQKVNTSNQFAYSDLTYEDYLYWKTATLSSVSGNTITISAKDANIHVGGLVKVDGSIYTIKAINTAGTILTLSGNPSESASGTIYYAIGHVVDHAGAESTGTKAGLGKTVTADNKGYGYGYYTNSPDDDGDRMIETVSTTGTRTIWSASINSNNIPDGPIELHYVAFDKAGNIAHGVVGASKTNYADAQVADATAASVANNAPRLAGVTVWSDYNGNGKGWRNTSEYGTDYESETKSKYFARVRPQINGKLTDRSNDVTSKLIVSSNDYGIEDDTAGTAFMKVTDTVKVIPELVGGNGQLYYEYKIGTRKTDKTLDTKLSGGTSASKLPLKNDSNGNVSGNDEGDEYPTVTDSNTTLTYVNGHTEGVITFDAANYLSKVSNSTLEAPTWFDIKIWDSTEGGTPYSNTLSCEMQIALMNKYNDETSPRAWITPFHWNSKDDNSVSWATDAEGNKTPEGHIELEGDLTSAIHTALSSTKLNPKVSGKIVVEGYAYDDIKLAKLYVSFADHSNIGSKTEASTYSSTGWSTTAYANGWGFSAQDVFCNAEGHLVKWTLTVDTAARTTKVATGKQVKIYAEAARGGNTYKNSIDTSSTQTVNLAQFVWSAVKSDTTNTYYTSPDRLTVATRANTADTAIVYANAYEYQWLNVKNSGGTYYIDLACTTAATSSTADTAKVYQKAQYTWSTVKSTVTPATQTTYFTDASCTTLANATTPDATVVYKNTMTSGYTVDIVPYVVKVETSLSKHKTSNPSVYNRTALGHYPVQSVAGKVSTTASGSVKRTTSSEDVILYGFNLDGSTVVLKNESNVEIKKADNSALAITKTAPTTSAMSSLKFNVATLPSGKLNVIVDSINIINNLNNNGAMGKATVDGTSNSNKYNMQGNGDTNNILTDDLVFDVWEFNDRAAVPINGLATGVQMQVNQNSHMLNFAFANGGLYYSMGDGTYSSQYWAGDWDTFAGPCVGFHVDSKGYTYGVDSGGDTNNSGHVDKYAFWTSRWNGTGTKGTGGTYKGNNSLRLEEIAYKTGGSDVYSYSLMKYRYLSSEFASSVQSNNSTNLYLVNYDALTNEIRFRAGNLSAASKESKGGFNDTYKSETPSWYATEYCQVIANNSKDGSSFPANGGTTTVAAIQNRGAGQYVSVAVATNGTGNKDAVCVVWYDAYSNSLKYTYYVDPISNWTAGDKIKGDRTAKGWSIPKTIFAEGGEYCQIAVDANNHIHIAAYAGNGDVKYAYLAKYDSDYVEKTNSCIVDASGAVGEHLTLDVALDSNGNSIPYIGYFTAAVKAPKYAYLVDTTHANKVPAGVDSNERFTGAWEVTVIPTPSRLTTNREDKVNIGVFKNAGVLNWSTTDGSAPANDKSNIGTSYSQSSTGDYDKCTEESKCYGNGSKNAVFAYQIAGGTGSCVESAQMR